MTRQHSSPILISSDRESAIPLAQLSFAAGEGAFSEADVQALIHKRPECLPIAEIDPVFAGPIAVCRELNTPAGPIDNLLVTPSGLPVIVECKLWRNPEGRREVVGQVLDYAKELSRWSSSDLQREVKRRVGGEGDPLVRLLRDAGKDVEEIAFNDALTLNLRRGRFLLLIVGDGIREGVEAIATYLQAHLGLHFSLGLVELPIFQLPDGSMLVTPRVLARTTNVTRQVIALPDGHALAGVSDGEGAEEDRERSTLATEQQRFWTEFLEGLKLDDPEQPFPRPAKQGYLTFMLPAPQGSSWLTVWRDVKLGQVGISLSWSRNSPGEVAGQALLESWDLLDEELGGAAGIVEIRGRRTIAEHFQTGDLADPEVRAAAFAWLVQRVNVWVNVVRPRVRSIVADHAETAE